MALIFPRVVNPQTPPDREIERPSTPPLQHDLQQRISKGCLRRTPLHSALREIPGCMSSKVSHWVLNHISHIPSFYLARIETSCYASREMACNQFLGLALRAMAFHTRRL